MQVQPFKLVSLLCLFLIVSACAAQNQQDPVIIEEGMVILQMEEESKESIYESLDQQTYYDGGEYIATAELSHSIPLDSEAEYNDLIELSHTDAQILYFGFDDCPYCKSFIPKLNQLAKEAGINYYYYDTELRSEDDNFDEILDNFELETVPLAILLKENRAVSTINHQSSMLEIERFVLSMAMGQND